MSLGLMHALEGEKPAATPVPASVPSRVNLPNGMTLVGYGCAVYWLMGGSPVFAVASVLLDELDGLVARQTGQQTQYGGLLDWAVDLTLTGLVGRRLGILPVVPVITAGQVYLREKNVHPKFGSARALLTGVTILKEAIQKNKKELSR